MVQKIGCNCRSYLTKHIGEYIIQLVVGNGQAILGTVLFAGRELGGFLAIPHQITKLANICERNKAAGNQIMLEDISNPLCTLLICFLSANRFDIEWTDEDKIKKQITILSKVSAGMGSAPNPFVLHFPMQATPPCGMLLRMSIVTSYEKACTFLAQGSIEEFDGPWYNSRRCVLCGLHTNKVKRSC